MISVPEDIQDQFRAASWHPGRINAQFAPRQASANPFATAVITEFGGLNVGACCSGQDMATSNVRFFANLTPAKSVAVAKWQSQFGPLAPIADAHHGHMIVFISGKGEYFVFTDPDEKLYFLGLTFGDAMRKLLLGLSIGGAIEPNTAIHWTPREKAAQRQ